MWPNTAASNLSQGNGRPSLTWSSRWRLTAYWCKIWLSIFRRRWVCGLSFRFGLCSGSAHPAMQLEQNDFWRCAAWHTLCSHRTVPCVLLKHSLLEFQPDAPSDKNYLTVLHFQRLGLSVSTPPVKLSLSVRGVRLKFTLQPGYRGG